MRIAVLLLLLLLVIPTTFGLAASIGNARAILRVEGSPEEPAFLNRTLQVMNTNDIPVKIIITPNSDIKKFIDIIDNDFELAPGEEKFARYTLTIDRGGKFDGKLNVAFIPANPMDGENSAGLTAALIIVSDGPLINEPEEEETPQPLVPPVEIVAPENPSNETGVTVGTRNPISPQVVETNPPQIKPIQPAGPSPVAGILIMVAIVGIGVGIFYLVKK